MKLACDKCDHVFFTDGMGRVPPWCPLCGKALGPNVFGRTPDRPAVAAVAAPAPPAVTAARPAPFAVAAAPPSPPAAPLRFITARRTGKRLLYRIYFSPTDLLLVKLGSGNVDAAQMVAAGGAIGGLIGGLVGSYVAWSRKQSIAERERLLDAAEEANLRAFVDQSRDCYRAGPEDVQWVRVEPPSWWRKAFTGGRHVGQLQLRHRRAGRLTFELLFHDDVRLAAGEIPRLFGDGAAVNVAWSSTAGCFVRPK
jgi:hypothetical protein